jgi:hypothetical protein
MLIREMITIYSDNVKHISTMWEEFSVYFYVKMDGTYSNHSALNWTMNTSLFLLSWSKKALSSFDRTLS